MSEKKTSKEKKTVKKTKPKAKRVRHHSALAQQLKAANDAEKTNRKDNVSSNGRDPITGRFTHGHKFSSSPTKWTEEKAMELATGLVKWMQDDPQHFMIGEYLIQHDLWDDVIAYLSDRYPQFSEHIARAKKIEEQRITMYALANRLNAGMAQWVLAVNHGKHNVQKTEVTGKDGAPIAPPSITIQPIAVKQGKDE